MRRRPGASSTSAVVRFAGDSGDGMQLTGAQFTLATALAGNDLATFPDFPAEIRAPVGTTFGVSAFQIHFGARRIYTVGDALDVLVAMNPAALKVNLQRPEARRPGDPGPGQLRRAQPAARPASPPIRVEDGSARRLSGGRGRHLRQHQGRDQATPACPRASSCAARTSTRWAWSTGCSTATGRPPSAGSSSASRTAPELADANIAALNAGHALGETAEMPSCRPSMSRAPPIGARPLPHHHRPRGAGLRPARRRAQGRAQAWSSAPTRSRRPRPCCTIWPSCAAWASPPSRPRTRSPPSAPRSAPPTPARSASPPAPAPASRSRPRRSASPSPPSCRWSSSTPSAAARRPACRPRPSSPTSTRRSIGRNADTPLVVLAAATPSDCFEVAIEAVRIAVHHMTPVMLLTDGYLANASEPWLIPDVDADPGLPGHASAPIRRASTRSCATSAWSAPGSSPARPASSIASAASRRTYDTGNISYDPANHQRMTDARGDKVLKVADDIPLQACEQGGAGRRARRGRLGHHLRPDRPRGRRCPRPRPGRRPRPPAPPLAPAPQPRRPAAQASTGSWCPR